MNIAIVEDEGITALFLKETAQELNHNVVGMFDEATGLLEDIKKGADIDLVLMDIKINGKLDGVNLAHKLYIEHPNISIVFITSFKDSETIKSAKDSSPVGYLIKPVMESDIEAILMVVESCRRDENSKNKNTIKIGKFSYNTNTNMLFSEGKVVPLSKNETCCIDMLIKSKNAYVSHEQLIVSIWKGENNRESSLRELMYRLRKKLDGLELKNVSKMGYILTD